jgi:hypothetical protein
MAMAGFAAASKAQAAKQRRNSDSRDETWIATTVSRNHTFDAADRD